MRVTPKRLFTAAQIAAQVGTTVGASPSYTTPEAIVTVIKKMTLNNTSGSAVAVTIYLVPSGSTAGATNAIWTAVSVAANSNVDVDDVVNHVLEAGDKLQMLAATGAVVNAFASGIETSTR